MSECSICGADPCVNPSFCAACRKTVVNKIIERVKPQKNGGKQKARGGELECAPDAIDLFERLQSFTGRFIAYPSTHAHCAHVLWIAHTHLMDAWESTPRIAFLSPEPASGKTRAVEITELLVLNPVEAVNVTPAYLFRKVGSEDGLPTVLYDEIDTVFGPKAKENEEIRGLLNAGHRRGAVAGRCVVKGKTVETEEIPAYCAVALAGLGWLPDTLLSRCVIIRMQRRKPAEKIEAYRRRVHADEGHGLRSQLAAWAAAALASVTDAWPDMPIGVEDRDADVWEPLLAIADVVDGDWPGLAREAAVALVAAAKEVEPSLGIRLLADLRTVFGDAESMATTAILAALHAMPEAPWNDLRGKPINDRGLAVRLRQYDVKSKTLRTGHGLSKGYARADLWDAWECYLPSVAGRSVTSVTSVTNADLRGPDVTDVTDKAANVTASNGAGSTDKMGHVTAVTDVTHVAGNGGEGRVCAQCGSGNGSLDPHRDGNRLVWLHMDTCKRFYERAQRQRTENIRDIDDWMNNK